MYTNRHSPTNGIRPRMNSPPNRNSNLNNSNLSSHATPPITPLSASGSPPIRNMNSSSAPRLFRPGSLSPDVLRVLMSEAQCDGAVAVERRQPILARRSSQSFSELTLPLIPNSARKIGSGTPRKELCRTGSIAALRSGRRAQSTSASSASISTRTSSTSISTRTSSDSISTRASSSTPTLGLSNGDNSGNFSLGRKNGIPHGNNRRTASVTSTPSATTPAAAAATAGLSQNSYQLQRHQQQPFLRPQPFLSTGARTSSASTASNLTAPGVNSPVNGRARRIGRVHLLDGGQSEPASPLRADISAGRGNRDCSQLRTNRAQAESSLNGSSFDSEDS